MADPQQDTQQTDDYGVVAGFMDKYQPQSSVPTPQSGGIDDIVKQTEATIKEMPSVNEMIDYDKRVTQAKADAAQKGIDIQKAGVGKLHQMQGPSPPGAPKLPQAPQPQLRDMFQAFQNPAVVLAGLASLATRAPLTAAFKAGAAALEGFHKGDQEVIKQNFENWKNETDRAIAQNRMETEQYREAWDKYKDDKTKLIAELQSLASISKDEIMLAELKQGANPERIVGLYQERVKSMTELAKAKAQIQLYMGRSMTMLTPEATQEMGQILAQTGTIPGGLSRFGQMDRAAIFNAATQFGGADERIANALDYRASGAAATVAGRGIGTIEGAMSRAEATAPRVIEASKNVDRTQYPQLNRIILAAKEGTGDENVVRMGIAMNTFVNAYARAQGGGNLAITNQARSEAWANLQKAWSDGQVDAAIDQMLNKELPSEREAAQVAKARVTGKGNKEFAKPPAATAAPAARPRATNPTTGEVLEWDGKAWVNPGGA